MCLKICLTTMVILFFLTDSHLIAQKKSTYNYFLSIEPNTYFSPYDITNNNVNSDLGLGINFHFFIEKIGESSNGISVGISSISYSYNKSVGWGDNINLNYIYLPVTYSFKYFENRKLNVGKFFYGGNIGYAFAISDAEYQNKKINVEGGYIVTGGGGYSFLIRQGAYIDLMAEAGGLIYNGYKIIDGEGFATILIKFSAAYRFVL